jgi:hypothetical protein
MAFIEVSKVVEQRCVIKVLWKESSELADIHGRLCKILE